MAPSTRTSISRTPGALPPANAGVTYFAAVVLPPMMPATCVPWPYGSPVVGAFPRHEIDARDHARVERGVRRDAGIDDRDADAAAVVAGRAEQAEQPARALPHRAGAGHLVGDRHVADDRRIRRDVRERGIVRHRVEFRARDLQRDRSLEFAADDAAQAAADRREVSFRRRLNDQPDAVAAHMGEISRQCWTPLTCRMRRKPRQQAQNDGDKEKWPTGHAFPSI